MNIKKFSFCVMALFMLAGCSQLKPKGMLIYCSYSCSRPAGGGKTYCELIADEGKEPKVVIVLDSDCHFTDEVRGEYKATTADVEEMQQLLEQLEVYKLNGYEVDEELDGAPTYRIYQEYADGTKVNAVWSGHKIKQAAKGAYSSIENFFEKWRKQAREEAEPADPDVVEEEEPVAE